MEFKIGDKVVLDNTRARGMSARIGATATIYTTKPCSNNCFMCNKYNIQIKWIHNTLRHGQSNGCYQKSMFKLVNRQVNRQLEFSFMEE